MDGTHLNNKIGIVGGGITGLISAYFLSLEGYKVDLYEKKTLLSETSSKTTKLIHGGIRYLENLQFHEVKNGINDRKWWLENFPDETKLQEIIILSKKKLSPEIFKFFFGIKVYETFAGRSNIKTGRLYKQDDLLSLGIKNNISAGISFYDGLMQESVGQEIIKRCKSNGVNFYENNEIKSIRSEGRIEEKQYKKIINKFKENLPFYAKSCLKIVDKQGNVTNVKIVRGVDKNLDAEALRVVSSLPKYKPGKQRGKNVNARFTLPIKFRIS